MRKKNLLFGCILFVITLAALLFGKMKTNKIEDAMADEQKIKAEQIPLNITEEENSKYFNIKTNLTYAELEKEADLIVRAKAVGKRLCYMQCTKTKLQVLEVIKGNNVKNQDTIYLYEPMSYENGYEIDSQGGYNLIHDNDEYILFLKHLQIPKGYRYKNEEQITYLPTTLLFSKYDLNSSDKMKVLREKDLDDGKIIYRNYADYEILATDQKKLDKFYELKRQVLKLTKER